MHPIDPRIFRAYDIRGVALEQLTVDAARQIARGYGSVLRERLPGKTPRVCVGRDARTHGPQLERAVIDGLVESGCDVRTIGATSSPLGYFTICDGDFDAGVQVTASHNPAKDNGLKLSLAHAHSFLGDDIQALRVRIEEGRFAEGKGTVEPYDGVTPYLAAMKDMFGGKLAGLKVVVDGGNGVAGPVNVEALRAAGAEVVELYIEPDGTFPNHPADPSKRATLKDLQEAVVREKADVGFAYDGDGDRLGLVDEKGEIRSSDEIILILAEDMLKRHPGTSVVSTVSNSSILDTEIKRLGGKPVMCKVGHGNVEHAMTESKALVGGEQSGHFFCFEDYHSFDDALVAALRIGSIVKAAGAPLSGLMSRYPKVYLAQERRPACPDDRKFLVIEEVKKHFAAKYPVETMDGARVDFGEGAWAGLRASNTSPCLSLCIEARSPEKLEAIENEILAYMKTFPEIDWEKPH